MLVDGTLADQPALLMTGGGEENMAVSSARGGESILAGRRAILDSPKGDDHIITRSFNDIDRCMNRAEDRRVWKAILNGYALPFRERE